MSNIFLHIFNKILIINLHSFLTFIEKTIIIIVERMERKGGYSSMICKVKESFELSEIEKKVYADFQEILIQMKEVATVSDTRHLIETIYCDLVTLIPQV